MNTRARMALAGFVCLAATGCGGGAPAAGPGSNGPLTLVDYGGATSQVSKEIWMDPFTKQTNIKMRHDAPNDYAKVKAQIDSGKIAWDVMFVQPYRAIVDCGTYFEKLDKSKITTVDRLPPLIGECGVPIDNFAYILVYDSKKFGQNPPTSWKDFFDLTKYPGKRGLSTAVAGGVLEAALLGDGVKPEELYPLDIDRAIRKYDSIKDNISFFESGARQMEQIESGDVVMSLAWHGRVQLSVRNGAEFKPVWNQHIRTHDTVAMIKGTPRKEEAYKFLSFITDVQQQKLWAEKTSYGAANKDAQPTLDQVGKEFDSNDPAHAELAVQLDLNWWAQHYEEAIDRYTKWSAQ
ncbi:ABC transporter substrate-binding protein [Sinosporangium siamense]|nr:ABC transporter substrate-binding protein [Sinosporangium siamense]